MKTIIKYILTFPQVLIHKLKGIKETYADLVSFFRYFPFGRINKDRTISFRFNGKRVNFFYGDMKPITAGIFKNREYEDVDVKGKMVVDIGAATGDTAIYFILKGATKVYGYELNKRGYDIAQKNIDLNNLRDKVNIEYCGIASKKIKSSDTILGAIIPMQDREDVDDANIKTLDKIVKEHNIHNAVLKVDTDGFEYDIFDTVKEETLRAFDTIVLEYHFGTKEIPNKLEKCGFNVKIGKAIKTHVVYHPKGYKNMEVGMIYAMTKKTNNHLLVRKKEDKRKEIMKHSNWEIVTEKQQKQLKTYGYENFKQHLGYDYFQGIIGLRSPRLLYLISLATKTEILKTFFLSRVKPFYDNRNKKVSLYRRILYRWYTALLYEYVRKMGAFGWVREPLEGNPILVKYDGQEFTQDLLNSALEASYISGKLTIEKRGVIAEIGAGYGRLAYVFLKAYPYLKYVIVDIAPPREITERYLTSQFPDCKIFKYRPFDSFKEIRKEFKASQICFISPDQFQFLPEGTIDLLVSIATFPEMKKEDIGYYFSQMKRLKVKYLYNKQNWEHYNPHDDYDFGFKDYPTKGMKLIDIRPAGYMTDFFEAIYDVNSHYKIKIEQNQKN